MKQFITRISAITVLLMGFVWVPLSARAASGPIGLQVSPAIVEINAERGKTYDIKVKITNTTTSDQQYYVEVNDFKAKDESGNPEFITDTTTPGSASLVKWIQPINSFLLNPSQSKEVLAKMVVPADAEPGGHYGIIRFGNQPASSSQTGTALAASVGPLVFVRVDGEVKESLTVADFYAQKAGKKKSTFEYGPIDFAERLTNSGNVHVKPSGNLVITNMFGGQVVNLPINDKNSNVLPNSTRRFEQRLQNKWLFGRYTAKMALSYGTFGGSISGETTFWVIPYKIIIAILLALVLSIILFRKMIVHYKRKIIEKALKEKQQSTSNKKD